MLSVSQGTTEALVCVSLDTLAMQKLHARRVGYFLGFKIDLILHPSHSFCVDLPTVPPIVSGCLTNNDCPDYTACQNRKCINPCAERRVCAPNAICTVTRHKAVCACPDGYIGSPEVTCERRKFNLDSFYLACQGQIYIKSYST